MGLPSREHPPANLLTPMIHDLPLPMSAIGVFPFGLGAGVVMRVNWMRREGLVEAGPCGEGGW